MRKRKKKKLKIKNKIIYYINLHNKLCLLYIMKKKTKNEILLYYNIRKLFLKKMGDTKLNNMYSNILINIVFLNCRYNQSTELIIKKFMETHKKDLIKLVKTNIKL